MTAYTQAGTGLRKHRQARKLSQSKLAQLAGFDHSYVSRIESGQRPPSADAIRKFAEVLEMPYADLCRDMGRLDFMRADDLVGFEAAMNEARGLANQLLRSLDFATGQVIAKEKAPTPTGLDQELRRLRDQVPPALRWCVWRRLLDQVNDRSRWHSVAWPEAFLHLEPGEIGRAIDWLNRNGWEEAERSRN